jgi:predicted TIM-barrel fold metal-dependent hydrolase
MRPLAAIFALPLILACTDRPSAPDAHAALPPSPPQPMAPSKTTTTASIARPKHKAFHRSVVDTHVHISPTEIDRAIDIFDEVGIAWAVNLSGMWPGGPLEEQLDVAKKSGRLVVACNLPWFAARKTKEFPQIAVKLLEQAKALGARALKVEKQLGLHARKYDDTLLKVDDPWLDPIWEAAGRLGMPVVIHTGDPKAFWLPSDKKNERLEELTAHPRWSYYEEYKKKLVPSFQELLNQLMNVVKKHPKTTFVSVHFGNNSEDPFWVQEMLDKYPNLNVDIAARVPELGRHNAEKLRRVFAKHQKRILFATDLGLSDDNFIMLGSFGKDPNTREEVVPFFRAYFRWLETSDDQPSPTPIQGRWNIHGIALPDEVLEDVYVNNAVRLFGPAPTK